MAEPVVALEGAAVHLGGRVLWRDLSLTLAPGEFLAVLGPNGTGKTTLLRALLGLQPLSAGTARVLGRAPRRGQARVGYIPQQRAFDADLGLRGEDLVRLGVDGHRFGLPLPWRHRQPVADALAAVSAGAYARAPVGLLSGGEQQRLRVAQALAAEPALLLCDEPLLSLDLHHQRAVTGLIDDSRRRTGAAVVFVTHEINPVLAYVDRVLYLAGGRFAAGTPDEVLTGERLSALYGTPVDVLRVRGRVVVVSAEEGDAAEPHGHHHQHHPGTGGGR